MERAGSRHVGRKVIERVMEVRGYPVEEWLDPGTPVSYRSYWEDEHEERRKPYWILDGEFDKLERHIALSRRVEQLHAIAAKARTALRRVVRGEGCELGAGVGWAVPHVLALGEVERVWCVEYSRHRLLHLAPAVLEHYGVPPQKVVLAVGDFNAIRLPDHSLNFVVMCAAFHHSDRPASMLAEIARVLKPDGCVLIVGELPAALSLHARGRHVTAALGARTPHRLQRRLLGRTLARRPLWPSSAALLEPDRRLGDHRYPLARYHKLFLEAGFEFVQDVDGVTGEYDFALAPRPR